MGGVPPDQAAGRVPGSAAAADRTRTGADARQRRSAVVGCRRHAGARVAAAPAQPGAGLAVAGPAALRARPPAARIAAGRRVRRYRHRAARHRDRRSIDHAARDPGRRQRLCVLARLDLRGARAGRAVRPVPRPCRDRGLYRDLGPAYRRRRRLGHRLCQCRAAARAASRRLCRADPARDAGGASLRRRHHPAVPPPGRRRHPRAGRSHRACGANAQPSRGALACAGDCARPRAVGGVGAQHPQRLFAAAAIFRRHHCGAAGDPPRHHGGAEPDRSRLPHQPGADPALPGARGPRQPLSAAAAQGGHGGDRLHWLRRAARGLGRRRHRLVLWRPDRISPDLGAGDDRDCRAGRGRDLGGRQLR
ncbi:hypothetical protein AB7M56_007564 [Bradyrhizobium elkanii]